MKTIEENFIDWESYVFGFGYGSGEEHTLAALKGFFAAFGVDDRPDSYDYQKLEQALTPPVAWLLINMLCRVGILEYGTSPRFGWLTERGEALKAFIDQRPVDALVELTRVTQDYCHCSPAYCNCDGEKCVNPFWK